MTLIFIEFKGSVLGTCPLSIINIFAKIVFDKLVPGIINWFLIRILLYHSRKHGIVLY